MKRMLRLGTGVAAVGAVLTVPVSAIRHRASGPDMPALTVKE